MNKLTTTIYLLVIAIVISCKNDKHEHWSYQGETSPEHWAEIEKNTSCDGQHQSPINIIETSTILNPSPKDLNVMYSPTTILNKVENNGHSIQFDFYVTSFIVSCR